MTTPTTTTDRETLNETASNLIALSLSTNLEGETRNLLNVRAHTLRAIATKQKDENKKAIEAAFRKGWFGGAKPWPQARELAEKLKAWRFSEGRNHDDTVLIQLISQVQDLQPIPPSAEELARKLSEWMVQSQLSRLGADVLLAFNDIMCEVRSLQLPTKPICHHPMDKQMLTAACASCGEVTNWSPLKGIANTNIEEHITHE